ncbi:MAG: hypothetical protein V1755_06850 [Chloroflexota bacterium]
MAQLPQEVLDLQQHGLTIEATEDLGSYKKIIPLLRSNPKCAVATADDDAYYPPDWLETLLRFSANGSVVVCRRARWVELDPDSNVRPYSCWSNLSGNPICSRRVMPIGVGGVLYPAGSVRLDYDDDLFLSLCPTADDVWLFWMRNPGFTQTTFAGGPLRPIYWWGTQKQSLYEANLRPGDQGNDAQIQRMMRQFGNPLKEAAERETSAQTGPENVQPKGRSTASSTEAQDN